jgi:hypothetical protein
LISSRVLRAVAIGVGLAVAGAPLGAQAQTSRVSTYRSALTAAQIAQLSANPNQNVIVVLRDQHPEVSSRSDTRPAREAKLSADQAPILGELRTLRAPKEHGYALINAVAATVSRDEASRLASNPTVAAVVPDSVVRGPSRAASLAAEAAAVGGRGGSENGPGSSQQICPSDPAKPLLEPEALQLMNVDFGAGASKPAAHDLATGKGVKIAVFPDGLDPNIPDFKRADGSSAIFDYVDFSGEGLFALTGGGEAFGDASSLISQGTQVYNLNGEVNPAHPLPPGCNIRVEGVAPDAAVAVMKVFGNSNFAFNSGILTAIEHAITVDKVDILSQSFGGNPVPNPGTDPIALLDSQAVAAGVTVVVSSGDAGTTNTIGSPSDAAGVISAGATTSYQIYAQTTSYGYQLGKGGWLSNEVSAFSSSGDTEYGPHTIDVVAPGENGWADCSTDTNTFQNCADIYHGTAPQPLDVFGGTSESCPLTAGTAALVIQAYRDTHDSKTPSPQLVKQIIMSSATDLHIPAQNQGAGFVNALRAVQMARSIHDANGSPDATGNSLLISPSSISSTAAPGQSSVVPVSVSNTGATSLSVSPSVRVLGSASPIASGTLTLDPAVDPTFIYQTGATAHDVHSVTFNVPAGTDRLVSRIAWTGRALTPGGKTIRADLFDPSGRMAAQSRPQGAGGGFGEDEIHNPSAGTWTLAVFDATGSPYKGQLTYSISGARFHNVDGALSPLSQSVAPGASATFAVRVATPSVPGDLAEAVVFHTSGGGGEGDDSNGSSAQGTIPVTTRALVPLDPQRGGSFAGTLTGGNARMVFYGQELVYQFDVPAGRADLNVDVTVGAPGYQIFGFLADPNMSPVDVQGSALQDGSPTNLQTMHLTWANPVAGRWALDLATVFGISSLLTSVPVRGTISFDQARVTSSGLPNSSHTKLDNGKPVTATIHVVNTGNSPAEYSLDPRLSQDETLSLSSLNPTTDPLPITDPTLIPQFVVPPFSTRLDMAATSTVPINFDTSPSFGFPELTSVQHGSAAVVSYQAPDIPASIWSLPPTEITTGLATQTTFSSGADAVTKAFDPAVDSSTGNIWSALEGLTPNYTPLVLQPGQSGDITVTITPNGSRGTVVRGFVAVETFNFNTISSDQLIQLPYAYRIH